MQKIKAAAAKLAAFLKRHRWSVLLLTLALAVGGFFIWDSFSAQTNVNFGPMKLRPKPITKVQAPLSGRLVTEEVARRQPIAVVIENHPDARPQSGLNAADMVYETLAEGGITRFLAFFQTEEPSQIGPVRSARKYFVEWGNMYKAPFAHVGGSREALNLIASNGTYDLNQFYLGNYFWRDNTRFAPHNVYTTLQKLLSAAKSKGYPTVNENIPSFAFKDEAKKENRPKSFSVKVIFNQPFTVTWTYLPEKNVFERKMLGVLQKDRVTKEPIVAKNLVVVFTSIYRESNGLSEITTVGSGKAYFYIDGVKQDGTWKATKTSPMKYFDKNSKEIKFNAGTTWVDVVPVGTLVN